MSVKALVCFTLKMTKSARTIIKKSIIYIYFTKMSHKFF